MATQLVLVSLLCIPVLSCTVFAQSSSLPSSAQSQTSPRLDPTPADANPSFDVATIKPSDTSALHGTIFRNNWRHDIASNISAGELIAYAYGLHAKQIVKADESKSELVGKSLPAAIAYIQDKLPSSLKQRAQTV